ncbi:hypothetical protein ABPG75_013319 [Micractinium tetrahymenae]
MRRAVLAATAAAVLLALAAAPAAAQKVQLQGDQVGILAQNDRQAALIQAITAGFAQLGEDERLNKTGPTTGGGIQGAVGSQPPPVTDASGAEVRSAIATVLAAASIQSEVLGTLGDPSFFKYPDGSGRVALYRTPKSRSTRCVCIFVHGCKHDPYSWFYKSPKCPQCTGLPEEVSHSKQCLAHGCAVLALMSKDRQYRSRCFSSSGDGSEFDQAWGLGWAQLHAHSPAALPGLQHKEGHLDPAPYADDSVPDSQLRKLTPCLRRPPPPSRRRPALCRPGHQVLAGQDRVGGQAALHFRRVCRRRLCHQVPQGAEDERRGLWWVTAQGGRQVEEWSLLGCTLWAACRQHDSHHVASSLSSAHLHCRACYHSPSAPARERLGSCSGSCIHQA